MIAFLICIINKCLITCVNYPCNFNEILSIIGSISMLFENVSNKEPKAYFGENKHEYVKKIILF